MKNQDIKPDSIRHVCDWKVIARERCDEDSGDRLWHSQELDCYTVSDGTHPNHCEIAGPYHLHKLTGHQSLSYYKRSVLWPCTFSDGSRGAVHVRVAFVHQLARTMECDSIQIELDGVPVYLYQRWHGVKTCHECGHRQQAEQDWHCKKCGAHWA